MTTHCGVTVKRLGMVTLSLEDEEALIVKIDTPKAMEVDID
jgi:hypothetical protein